MKRHIRLLLAVMISFICCLGTYAQEQRATITGVVKDINGESSRVSGGNFTLPSLGTVLDSLPSHGSSYLTLLFIN